jgi:hypothetical protein
MDEVQAGLPARTRCIGMSAGCLARALDPVGKCCGFQKIENPRDAGLLVDGQGSAHLLLNLRQGL